MHPVDDAPTVYDALVKGATGVGHLFEYPDSATVVTTRPPRRPPATTLRHRSDPGPRVAPRPGDEVRLGFVGAGAYASSVLLPHLAKAAGTRLMSVATTTSLSAANAQRRFGFQSVTTDADAVLDDPSVDAVFVVTRHHSHARFVCAALERGKAVFVEKPLALSEQELEMVVDTVTRTGNQRLMVGFNRRFAPLVTDMRQRFGPGNSPVLMRYLVNAGRLDAGSWYADEETEGSRFVGEGGHFIDLMSAWVGAPPVQVHAAQPRGASADLQLTLSFGDGSLGTLTYTTDGARRAPKETFDCSGGGRCARLDNFTRATVWHSGGSKDVKRAFGGADKGQGAALDAFLAAVRTGAPMPIPLESVLSTTRATLAAQTSLQRAEPVSL